MLKKFFKYLFLVLFISFNFGCTSQNNDLEPLHIGMNTWPGHEPFVLAKENGFLNDNVKISRINSATDVMKALRSDIIDIAFLTLDEAIVLQNKCDEAIKIITIIDFSTGGDVLISKKEILSLQELKGKQIAVESTALGLFMLTRILELTPGLDIKDLKVVNLGYEHHESVFNKGNIDAIITFEPIKTKLLQNENAHVLFDSTQIPGEILDVMVIKEKSIKNKKNAIKSALDGWYKSIEHISIERTDSLRKMAGYEDMTFEDFKIAYHGIKIPSREENIDFFKNQLNNTINKVAKVMIEKEIIKKTDSDKLLYTDLFLHK